MPRIEVALMRQGQAVLEEAQVGERDAPGQDRRVGGEERGEDVAGGDAAADGQHRRPGDPVAPDRERRDDPSVADPGGGAVDRGPAGLARKQAGDLGIGVGLDVAHQHRDDPDHPGRVADRGGDAADREQDQRRHAAGDPEHVAPGEVAPQPTGRRVRSQMVDRRSGRCHGADPRLSLSSVRLTALEPNANPFGPKRRLPIGSARPEGRRAPSPSARPWPRPRHRHRGAARPRPPPRAAGRSGACSPPVSTLPRISAHWACRRTSLIWRYSQINSGLPVQAASARWNCSSACE